MITVKVSVFQRDFMVGLIHFLLSQWELPAAPAGPGWDDSVQSRTAWRREGQPQKDLIHQKPKGEQRLAGVLPPGCDWKPHYHPVITEESSDVLCGRVAPCARPVSVGSSMLSELAVTLEQLMGRADALKLMDGYQFSLLLYFSSRLRIPQPLPH